MNPTSNINNEGVPRNCQTYICRAIDTATGRHCGRTFIWPQHLRRHDRAVHRTVSTTFIHMQPGLPPQRRIHTTSRPATVPATQHTALSLLPQEPMLPEQLSTFRGSSLPASGTASFRPSPSSGQARLQPSLDNAAEGLGTLEAASETSLQVHAGKVLSPRSRNSPSGMDDMVVAPKTRVRLQEQPTIAFAASDAYTKPHNRLHQPQSRGTTSYSAPTSSFGPPIHDHVGPDVFANDSADQREGDRDDIGALPRVLPQRTTSDSGLLPAHTQSASLPSYDIRVCKKAAQIKALPWLHQPAKIKYDETYRHLLAPWWLSLRHTGTCLLLPQDWRFSDPLDLMALFAPDNCPSRNAARLWYSHANYGTTLARAKVWFDQLYRTGLDLDIFIGCSEYKPMDASHLCHHGHCVIHVIYESADINQDRQNCCRRARFLRAEGRAVPNHCTLHEPPCMMQVRSPLIDGDPCARD